MSTFWLFIERWSGLQIREKHEKLMASILLISLLMAVSSLLIVIAALVLRVIA